MRSAMEQRDARNVTLSPSKSYHPVRLLDLLEKMASHLNHPQLGVTVFIRSFSMLFFFLEICVKPKSFSFFAFFGMNNGFLAHNRFIQFNKKAINFVAGCHDSLYN